MQELVQLECESWASKGVNVKYEVRDNRRGYKAGALREGMKHAYVRACDLVAIFDADFQPDPDFLHRAVPFLIHNPDVALVQARWKFGSCSIFTLCIKKASVSVRNDAPVVKGGVGCCTSLYKFPKNPEGGAGLDTHGDCCGWNWVSDPGIWDVTCK
jgi:hypothetical protein